MGRDRPESRSDAEIILASIENPDEFGEIFDRHYDRVYAYAARRLKPSDAADVTAEVFLKAFRLRKRFDVKYPSCFPWLLGIARNTAGDRLRATKRRERVYLRLQGDTTPSMSDQADERLVAEATSRQLNSALGALPRNDREAFLLFAVDGLTYAEIGATLNIPAGTVGSRIARARRKILQAIPNLRQITEREDKGS